MQTPLFVRPLTEQEQAEFEAGRQPSQGFTVRRSQVLLASAQGKSTPTIARLIGCSDQTVRNAIADFHQRGLDALQPKSSRPHTTHEVFDEQGRERLRTLLHQSPRNFYRTHAGNGEERAMFVDERIFHGWGCVKMPNAFLEFSFPASGFHFHA